MKQIKILKGEIPTADAAEMAANWRTYNSNETINGYTVDQIMPNAYTISVDDLKKLSEEPGVSGIRIYFGYMQQDPEPLVGDNFSMRLMMVGVDANGNDIILSGEGRSGIYDHFEPCPNTCDVNSPLS